MVLGTILTQSNIAAPRGDKSQFYIQAEDTGPVMVGQVQPSGYTPDHDVLISHIFGRVPTDAMLTGRTPRSTGFTTVAEGLAKAANKMVGSNVLSADHAAKLVEAGKHLLLVGMKQAPDATALEGSINSYVDKVVDRLKPYAEWGGVAGLAALGGKEAVLNYMRSAAVAVQPFVANYGRITSYISRMVVAGNLTAVTIGITVLMQADIQRGMARAQNSLKGGGALSEHIGPPWAGYQVGDWVSVRYFEGTSSCLATSTSSEACPCPSVP